MQEWYRPERIVIAGAGMAHEELVELADKHFSLLKRTESTAAPPLPSLSSNNSRTAVPPHLLPSSPPPSVLKSLTRAASYLYPQSNASSTSPMIEPVDTPSVRTQADIISYTTQKRSSTTCIWHGKESAFTLPIYTLWRPCRRSWEGAAPSLLEDLARGCTRGCTAGF